ncbi:hypothetical protein G7Y89_g14120 [Cudoniella acicularis]|uniref:Uncharacterized protein n=1 Tax=Cudoniella acicularis TaxID=354080 RepID=A0A8H4R8E1_9HELO|nr:hypothetical protein G7Y89_g14120 [Cudoniella acicularis]
MQPDREEDQETQSRPQGLLRSPFDRARRYQERAAGASSVSAASVQRQCTTDLQSSPRAKGVHLHSAAFAAVAMTGIPTAKALGYPGQLARSER